MRIYFVLLFFLAGSSVSALAGGTKTPVNKSSSTFYLKVQLGHDLKMSSLKPGDVVEGDLSRPVYWRDKEVFPAGSRVNLVVKKMELRRREPSNQWPWIVRVFTPHHEKYPTFQTAQMMLPDGKKVDLEVGLVSYGREVELHVGTPKKGRRKPETAQKEESSLGAKPSSFGGGRRSKHLPDGPIATLEAMANMSDLPAAQWEAPTFESSAPLRVSAGTEARVVLLEDLSASGSRPGAIFHARLLEPVFVGSAVALPAGSIFEGKITKSRGPRMLSRSGSLAVLFSHLRLPDGGTMPLEASLSGVDLTNTSHTKIDAEGQLHGDRTGAAWMLINLGVTGGVAKVVDDGTQLAMQAVIAGATDASTAGISRIVASCISGVFLLTRHGRDVLLPKFTEMELTFDRPVVVKAYPSVALLDQGNAQEPSTEDK